ncbi:MAG: hypothetical protein D6763_04945 [Alphaproteobacteria bacterium]|nr:MAG: hypothetical protein D6763_04945 [Alphaproteobacteria bacterium]
MTVSVADTVAPTRFQQAVLSFRGHCNILNAGGRGSGKSFSMMLDLLDHCRLHGADARPLVMRESWGGLLELTTEVLDLASAAFGRCSRNKAEGTIYLPTGGVVTFTNIGDENSYARHQGRSYTGLFADEVGNYPPQAFAFLQRVRSNLRVPSGRRVDIHLTANPHGRSHTVLFKNFISKAPPWHPFQDNVGDWWIWTTSTLEDNPYIDRVAYRRQLVASTGTDQALADAWINGDWSVLGGVMFDVFDPAVHIIRDPAHASMRLCCGGDWGTAAPATCILLGQLKSDVGPYRYGSIIALDETDTADPSDLSLGNGAPPQAFAEMVREMSARHGWRNPHVVMDDARGLQSDTVIQLLRENGIGAHKPIKKDRVGQWSLIRSLLSNAVTGDGPGLYFTNRCPHLLETLPEAPRGTLRPEDIDPKWPRDHWLDALAYGVRDLWGNRATSGRHTGMY